jgi:hypothetical protein
MEYYKKLDNRISLLEPSSDLKNKIKEFFSALKIIF